MAVRIQLFAAFADFCGTREVQIPHRSGLTCEEIWNEIRARYPKVAGVPPLFAIYDEYVRMNTLVNDGDVVMLFPPVSGGEARFIYDEALSVERALSAIQDPNAGGEALFIGRIRRVNEGKTIRYLDYECQTTMAEKEVAKIISEMFERWALARVHIEHRIGRLEVGDLAVIVAVSSEHRREAIEACRYGIDEIKHRVPIWKKEVSESGEEWIGACADEDQR